MRSAVIYSNKEIQEMDGREVAKYTVTSVNKYGTFTSSVRVHDEDAEFANDFIGYDFAERKNDIKTLGVKTKLFEQRVIEVNHLYKTAKDKFGEDSEVTKYLEHQYGIVKRDYDKLNNQYLYMRDGFKDYTDRYIKKRQEVLEKLDATMEKIKN